MSPILYDLKRSLLRTSTIVLLIVFTSLGTGISYLISSIYKQMSPTLGVHLYGFYNTTHCYINGVVIDTNGQPVDKFQVAIDDVRVVRGVMNRREIAKFEFNKNLPLEGERACSIVRLLGESSAMNQSTGSSLTLRVESNGESAKFVERRVFRDQNNTTVWITGGLITSGSLTYTSLTYASYGAFPPSNLSIKSMNNSMVVGSYAIKKNKAMLIIIHPIDLVSPNSSLRVEYGTFKEDLNEERNVGDFESLDYIYLGEVDKGSVKVFTITLDLPSRIVVKLDSGIRRDYFLLYLSSPMEASFIAYLFSSLGIGLYYLFFPILFLYVAYVFIAKPKTSGSLEFLLARPVTRGDIYFTRFVAGVLLAFTATGLFLVSVNLASRLLVGYSMDPLGFMITYLGLTASLASTYSLFYLLASGLRGGAYIGVSIIVYLILYIFWDMIVTVALVTSGILFKNFEEAVKISYTLSYFNPAGVYELANVFLAKHYGATGMLTGFGREIRPEILESVVNPVAVALQPFVLTATFLHLGYMVFKKTNLSQ